MVASVPTDVPTGAPNSLEFRRTRLDLVFAYKVIFNLVDVNRDEFFTVRINHSRRIHRYELYVPYSKTTARYNYFSYRVSRIWNALTLDDVDFEFNWKRIGMVL